MKRFWYWLAVAGNLVDDPLYWFPEYWDRIRFIKLGHHDWMWEDDATHKPRKRYKTYQPPIPAEHMAWINGI